MSEDISMPDAPTAPHTHEPTLSTIRNYNTFQSLRDHSITHGSQIRLNITLASLGPPGPETQLMH